MKTVDRIRAHLQTAHILNKATKQNNIKNINRARYAHKCDSIKQAISLIETTATQAVSYTLNFDPRNSQNCVIFKFSATNEVYKFHIPHSLFLELNAQQVKLHPQSPKKGATHKTMPMSSSSLPSLFITFEGPEGSGKSSAMAAVVNTLRQEGYEVVCTREPGGTPISEQIRSVILDPNNTSMDPRTEALLYAAARRQHLTEKIWPALSAGKIVICDRYLDSSLAYQGHARGLGIDLILDINSSATESTFPDLTLLFDLDPRIGLSRIAANTSREVNRLDLESLPFHQSVREGYLALVSRFPSRFRIIDASRTPSEVAASALYAIHALLKHPLERPEPECPSSHPHIPLHPSHPSQKKVDKEDI